MHHRALLLVLALLAGLAACASPGPPAPGIDTIERIGLPHAGAPVVVALHGPEGGAARFARIASFSVQDEGWAIVLPETDGAGWMDPALGGAEALTDYLEALIARGEAAPDRLFLLGFSDGGQAALALACARPDLIAGVAAVMASPPAGAGCSAREPVPTLLIHAASDPILPFLGGPVGQPADRGLPGAVNLAGPVLAADESTARAALRNGCGAARRVEIPDTFPEDGTRVTQRVYDGCLARTTQFVIEGGGHAWPGARLNRRLTAAFGRPALDISATVEIEDFFRIVMRER